MKQSRSLEGTSFLTIGIFLQKCVSCLHQGRGVLRWILQKYVAAGELN